jgi:hypothetical protein
VVRAHPTVPETKISLWFQHLTDRPDVFARAKYKRRYKMALRMVALRRTKTGLVARKGIPVDVREPYARLYGVGWEAKLKLPADISKHEAKARHGEWLADVEMRIAALRATAKGEGQPVTRLNAIALAGRWYTWFVGQHEDHPGTPQQWRKLSDHIAWNILRPEAPEEYEENSQADPEWEWAKTPEVRARVRPQIAELARVASFLASAGMALEDKAHTLFVDAVSDNLLPALSLLERRAQGDYTWASRDPRGISHVRYGAISGSDRRMVRTTRMTSSGHAGRLPSPRVFLTGEEPAFNILFVGHPTPANLSERLARTGHSGDRALPTVTITCRGPVESISLRPPKGWRLVHLHLARPSRFVVT